MAETIVIEKDKLPYIAKYKFPNGTFDLQFRYNENSDTIYCDLLQDDVIIHENEKLILNVPLFWLNMVDLKGNINPIYPNKFLVPVSVDAVDMKVNLENIENKIVLLITDIQEVITQDFDYFLYK